MATRAQEQGKCDLVRTMVTHGVIDYGMTKEEFLRLVAIAYDYVTRPLPEVAAQSESAEQISNSAKGG